MPQFSILTPSYGYARFIGDAIASVKAQGEPVEHVVADGDSTDGTVELLQEQADLVWVSEPDQGQSDALNHALSLSSGDIVGWLNADEFYLPGALAKVRNAFENSDVDVVYGDAIFVDVEARFMRLVAQHRFSRRALRSYGTFIPSCAVFFRRDAIGNQPWDVDVRRIMDWDLYLRLAARGATFRHIRAPLGAFRVHAERVTASPAALTHPEQIRIRNMHGLPTTPGRHWARNSGGHVLHALLKISERAYLRQKRAAPLAQIDMRWWPPHELDTRTTQIMSAISD